MLIRKEPAGMDKSAMRLTVTSGRRWNFSLKWKSMTKWFFYSAFVSLYNTRWSHPRLSLHQNHSIKTIATQSTGLTRCHWSGQHSLHICKKCIINRKQGIINTTLLKQKPSLYLQSHKTKYKYFCHSCLGKPFTKFSNIYK